MFFITLHPNVSIFWSPRFRFDSRSGLADEASHENRRTHICQFCGAGFTRGDALKRHLKTSKNGKKCVLRIQRDGTSHSEDYSGDGGSEAYNDQEHDSGEYHNQGPADDGYDGREPLDGDHGDPYGGIGIPENHGPNSANEHPQIPLGPQSSGRRNPWSPVFSPSNLHSASHGASVTPYEDSSHHETESPGRLAPLAPEAQSTLYPGIPDEFFPSFEVAEKLLETHFRYHHSAHSFIHIPTFMHRLRKGIVCPELVLALLWSGLVMLEPWTEEAATLTKCMDEAALGIECLARIRTESERMFELANHGYEPDANRAVDLLKATVTARAVLIGRGEPLLNEFHNLMNHIYPFAKFGLLPGDDARARNPRDLGGWIWAEERTRLSTVIAMIDAAISDVSRKLPLYLPNRGRIAKVPGRNERSLGPPPPDPCPWLDMAVPCPDLAFDALPPAPMTDAEEAQWHARDLAQGGILDTIELRPVREVVSWIDFAPGSPERARVAEFAFGGLLRNGNSAFYVVFTEIWARVLVCRDYYSKFGFKLWNPPTGNTENEIKARELREQAVLVLQEFFASAPDELRELDANADGAGLRELAGRWWGRGRAHRLTHVLVFIHSLDLILNTPAGMWLDVDATEAAWPASEAFIQAEANAITISRLMRSLLSMPLSLAASNLPAEVEQERYRRHLAQEARHLPPIWAIPVVRAAWVHCMAIRRFRMLLKQQATLDNAAVCEAIKTVKELVGDVEACLGGMAECGHVWKNAYAAYMIMRSVLARTLTDQDPSGWALMTADEVGMLRKLSTGD